MYGAETVPRSTGKEEAIRGATSRGSQHSPNETACCKGNLYTGQPLYSTQTGRGDSMSDESDIEKQLREYAGTGGSEECRLMRAAADEIERLTASMEEMRRKSSSLPKHR